MGLSFEQVQAVQDEFVKEYMFKDPYREYLNACGIGRDGGELCLRVHLLKPFPPDMALPADYQGVKIIISGTGEIRAL